MTGVDVGCDISTNNISGHVTPFLTGPSTRIKVRISGEYDLDAADLEGAGLPEGDFTDEEAAMAARYWWYETEPHPKATLSVEVTRPTFCPGDALPGIDPPPRTVTTRTELDL